MLFNTTEFYTTEKCLELKKQHKFKTVFKTNLNFKIYRTLFFFVSINSLYETRIPEHKTRNINIFTIISCNM